MKNSFIEKTYVVGTHWNCLIEAIPMCTYNICYSMCTTTYVTENNEKLFGNLHFSCIMFIVLTSFKHLKLPVSIKIPFTLLQIVYTCMTAISLNLISWTTSLLTWYLHRCNIWISWEEDGWNYQLEECHFQWRHGCATVDYNITRDDVTFLPMDVLFGKLEWDMIYI